MRGGGGEPLTLLQIRLFPLKTVSLDGGARGKLKGKSVLLLNNQETLTIISSASWSSSLQLNRHVHLIAASIWAKYIGFCSSLLFMEL